MLRNAVVGTWELVSYTEADDDGGPSTYPLGPDALGLIMYTADGYMSAQIMRPDRPAYDRPETGGGTPEQAQAAAAGYLAYSGPFTVDGNTGKPQGFEPREARFMLIEIRRHRVAQPTVGIAGMRNQW